MSEPDDVTRAERSEAPPRRAAVHLIRSDSVVTLELDRPEKYNALDTTLSDGILRALDAAADVPLPLVIRSRQAGDVRVRRGR